MNIDKDQIEIQFMEDPEKELEIEKSFENSTNYDLFKLYFENKSLKVRNELVLRNRPLVTFIVNTFYSSKKIPIETKRELYQEGIVGLLSAIDGYDYRKGYKFSTYSSWWIRQAVNNYLINVCPLIKVPTHVRAAQNNLVKKLNEYNKNLNDYLDEGDQNKKLNISDKMFNSVKSAINSRQVTSLNKPIHSDNENITLGDVLPNNHTNADVLFDKQKIIEAFKEALKTMPRKKRLILLLRYDVLGQKLNLKTK